MKAAAQKVQITLQLSAAKYRLIQDIAREMKVESLTFFNSPSFVQKELKCSICQKFLSICNNDKRNLNCYNAVMCYLFEEAENETN
ncbi:hypothetical protein FACS189447_07650 [Spirochaetia bacterium]|nr:hypothetical protein FACS189447_07650 [Spirochaetia bacterium]